MHRQSHLHPSARSRRAFAVALLAGLALGGCGTTDYLFPSTETALVRVQAAGDANMGFPVALDIVVVSDETAAPILSALSARDWFTGKTQYLADYQGKMDVTAYEVVPGQSVPDVELSRGQRASAKAVLVFANYVTNGVHRARIDTIQRALIALEREQFRALSLD